MFPGRLVAVEISGDTTLPKLIPRCIYAVTSTALTRTATGFVACGAVAPPEAGRSKATDHTRAKDAYQLRNAGGPPRRLRVLA